MIRSPWEKAAEASASCQFSMAWLPSSVALSTAAPLSSVWSSTGSVVNDTSAGARSMTARSTARSSWLSSVSSTAAWSTSQPARRSAVRGSGRVRVRAWSPAVNNTGWRAIRPRSPVGSVRHRPSEECCRSRDRAKARAWDPSSRWQPACSIARPDIWSRTGAASWTSMPPTRSTSRANPPKSISTTLSTSTPSASSSAWSRPS